MLSLWNQENPNQQYGQEQELSLIHIYPAVHLTDLSRVKAVAQALPQEGKGDIPSDVNGSYTGTPTDGGTPVQDADDL